MTASDSQTDKFTQAANFTFHPSVEGGSTVDDGGATNYGITQNSLDKFTSDNGYNKISVNDMTPDDAKFVARKQYWDNVGLENLPNKTAVAAFDYSINSGPYQAVKDLQRVVGVRADGRMGPQTQKAVDNYINTNGEDSLISNYNSKRAELMHNLVVNNPKKYGDYAKGWANRIINLNNYLGIDNGVNVSVNSNIEQ